MPRYDKPDDPLESTLSLTAEDIDAMEVPDDDYVKTGTRHARDVIIPFDYNPEEPITEQLHAADEQPPQSEEVPFSLSEVRPPPVVESEPDGPTEIFTSRPPPPVEPVAQPAPRARPAPTPRPPPVVEATSPSPSAAVDDEDTPTTPGWVVVYLVLCGVLTLVGLVLLFIERHMLGSASPF